MAINGDPTVALNSIEFEKLSELVKTWMNKGLTMKEAFNYSIRKLDIVAKISYTTFEININRLANATSVRGPLNILASQIQRIPPATGAVMWAKRRYWLAYLSVLGMLPWLLPAAAAHGGRSGTASLFGVVGLAVVMGVTLYTCSPGLRSAPEFQALSINPVTGDLLCYRLSEWVACPPEVYRDN